MSPSGRKWTTWSTCGRTGRSWRSRTQVLLHSLGSSALPGTVQVRSWGGDSPSLATMFDFLRNGNSSWAAVFTCLLVKYLAPFVKIFVAEIWSALSNLIFPIIDESWSGLAETTVVVPETMLELLFFPLWSKFTSVLSLKSSCLRSVQPVRWFVFDLGAHEWYGYIWRPLLWVLVPLHIKTKRVTLQLARGHARLPKGDMFWEYRLTAGMLHRACCYSCMYIYPPPFLRLLVPETAALLPKSILLAEHYHCLH